LASVDDLDGVLEQFKQAGQEFVKGNSKPVQELFSHREDVTLANPFGPPALGWPQVSQAQDRGASVFRDGEIYNFETVAKYVTPELACILWIERTNGEGRRQRRGHPMRSAGHDDPSPGPVPLIGPGLYRACTSENADHANFGDSRFSRHSGEASSTVAHPPKLGHIGQTVNARGFAYATCCTLRPLTTYHLNRSASVM
jgi:hypothetical protein